LELSHLAVHYARIPQNNEPVKKLAKCQSVREIRPKL
jgi:hypothetical protein